MLEVTIEKGGRTEERTLQELALSRELVVSSVVRGEEIVTPRGDTRFQAGDIVFVLAPARMLDDIQDLLNGKGP